MFRKPGFTVIELLVTMTVISVLLCLLLPGIRTAREVAGRTQCRNRLQQIGFALHNYNETFSTLPPGVVNSTGPIRNEAKGYHHSWMTSILPYLDQAPLYKNLAPKLGIYDDANLKIRQTVLPVLFCPSDDSPKVSSADHNSVALSNYVGNHHPETASIDFDNHGVLFLNSRVRYKDIYDGAAHTLLVGEALRSVDDLGWASGTKATLRNGGSGLHNSTTRMKSPSSNSDVKKVALHQAIKNDPGHFESDHPGMCMFLFCDGSARALSININLQVLQKLLDRADGQLLKEEY